jgi:hypothetical protein
MKTLLILLILTFNTNDLPFDAIDIENMEVTNNGSLVTFLQIENNHYFFYIRNDYYKLLLRRNSLYNNRVMYLVTYENEIVEIFQEQQQNIFK